MAGATAEALVVQTVEMIAKVMLVGNLPVVREAVASLPVLHLVKQTAKHHLLHQAVPTVVLHVLLIVIMGVHRVLEVVRVSVVEVVAVQLVYKAVRERVTINADWDAPEVRSNGMLS